MTTLAMPDQVPPDHLVRQEAVDGRRSYIVQAPAGSGKTELLVQRFLRLLGEVQHPEAIVAITFTRKAASEMRNRIVDAMTLAAEAPRPAEAHRARTWDLASRALEADRVHEWDLRRAPRRLRVQTIDSLCSDLVRQLPLLSRMGADAEVAENADQFYRAAAEQALDLEAQETGELAMTLLRHVDGNLRRAIQLLADLLARRDQWIPYIGASAEPPMRLLEQSMAALVHGERRAAVSGLGLDLISELHETACRAIANLAAEGKSTTAMDALAAMREPDLEAASFWTGTGAVYLTKSGGLRKTANKTIGVPAPKDVPANEREAAEALKRDFNALLTTLSEHPGAHENLVHLSRLPEPYYAEDERATLSALLTLLPHALAYLQLEFSQAGVTDFAEVQLRAIAGLGHPDAPTDLALALDHRIEHLLVDEFQDTSNPQVELLSRLCAGWEPHDGRTLFIVGDPMQSIYRFRKAEVGNFLKARRYGIAHIQLKPLELSANFRSQAGIVEWVNTTFSRLLPSRDDASLGRISYAASTAINRALPGEAVYVHPVAGENTADQAAGEVEAILGILTSAMAEPADEHGGPQTTAILVRARAHLARILPALWSAGIAFQAVELDRLTERQVVLDLHALARLLIAPDDKAVWLAVLRAPWCGLLLDDLHALFREDSDTWLDLVLGEVQPDGMSADGLARLHHWQHHFRHALDVWRHQSLARVVETLWVALDGPGTVPADAMVDARTYLDLLSAEEVGGTLIDLQRFEHKLRRQFAASTSRAESPVQVMTMHKAKGLEFDVVLLPGLGRRPANADKPLLAWQERTAHDVDGTLVDRSLVMAPISGHREDSGLYALIRNADTALDHEEQRRLLYVAATRARRRLHLFGAVGWDADENQGKPPAKNSLLQMLWPIAEAAFTELQPPEQPADGETAEAALLLTRRSAVPSVGPPLPMHGHAEVEPTPPETGATFGAAAGNGIEADLEFDWAGETARHTGTLVHRWLERMALDGLEHWHPADINAIEPSFEASLRNLGVLPDTLEEACGRVATALKNALSDPRGRWLLERHEEGHAELALTAASGDSTSGYVVDRTFIDSDGTRWIVDYKTGVHEGGDVAAFLDNEQARYRQQLEGYARLLAEFEQRPTRLALYFPVLGAFREWAFRATGR